MKLDFAGEISNLCIMHPMKVETTVSYATATDENRWKIRGSLQVLP